MQKTYFHNYKNIEVDEPKKVSKIYFKKKTTNVDINQLLNRVKDVKKNKRKEKIIIFGTAILIVSLMAIFVILTR